MSYDLGVLNLGDSKKKKNRTLLYVGVAVAVVVVAALVWYLVY